MLIVKNINQKFGKQQIITNFNYDFEKGKSYAILGKSGSGKSTLLRIIAGLQKPTSGYIELNNKQHKKPTKELYYLHQNYTNFPWLTALENVLLGVSTNKKEIIEKEKEALTILRSLGLIEPKKMIYEMSGGMNQRVALARMIIANPEVILLDEPTSALDEQTTKVVENLLLSLKAKGKTLIIVTHNKDVANNLADKIINL